MGRKFSAVSYADLKRGVYYFVAIITVLSVAGCKNPLEPEKSAFEKYTACISASRDALGDDVEEVCFRKFASEGGRFGIDGNNWADEPGANRITVVNKGDNLIMVESIFQQIDHDDGSDPHRIVKDCVPRIVMPRKTEKVLCKNMYRTSVDAFREGVEHHESDAPYWNFLKVLFIKLD